MIRSLTTKGETYVDSASTSLRPEPVIETVTHFWREQTSNIARSNYTSAENNTFLFEETRGKVAALISAERSEIVFTTGTTHSLNLASLLLQKFFGRKLRILVSPLEHHSNYLPWLEAGEVTFLKLLEDGTVDLAELGRIDFNSFDVLALQHVSNISGNVNPVAECCALARAANVVSVIDGAQAVGHFNVDVAKIGCDFYAFSGHKMFAPAGVGALFISAKIEPFLKPLFWGGGMVNFVDSKRVEVTPSPQRFEAGTPPIEGVLGLGAAIDFINSIGGVKAVHKHNQDLEAYAREKFSDFKFLSYVVAPSTLHLPIFTFSIASTRISNKALAAILVDSYGLNLSYGFQCCQLYYRTCEKGEAIRVSFHLYNTRADVDAVVDALSSLVTLL